jgi:hypothetical protein
MDHDQFVEALVTTRLDDQRGLNDADAVGIFLFPLAQDLILTRDDERVKQII